KDLEVNRARSLRLNGLRVKSLFLSVRGLAVPGRPQYLRGPQQRRLVQLRLPVRSSMLLLRQRQPGAAAGGEVWHPSRRRGSMSEMADYSNHPCSQPFWGTRRVKLTIDMGDNLGPALQRFRVAATNFIETVDSSP